MIRQVEKSIVFAMWFTGYRTEDLPNHLSKGDHDLCFDIRLTPPANILPFAIVRVKGAGS